MDDKNLIKDFENETREQPVSQIYLDEAGREIPNPVPMSPPIGYVKHKTIAEQMREMIQQASFEAKNAGAETEDEANDFDIDEDYDPYSPWEHNFDPDPEAEAMLALSSRPAAAPSEPYPVAQREGVVGAPSAPMTPSLQPPLETKP